MAHSLTIDINRAERNLAGAVASLAAARQIEASLAAALTTHTERAGTLVHVCAAEQAAEILRHHREYVAEVARSVEFDQQHLDGLRARLAAV